MPKFLSDMDDIEVEEGFMATFKVKLDLGYPRARVLFYKNEHLILNDQRHEICKRENYFHILYLNLTLFKSSSSSHIFFRYS